jgi:hypothetical protein
MFSDLNKTIVKYVIYAITVFAIINYMTKSKLSTSEYILIGLPIIGVYIILDSISNRSEKVTITKVSPEKFEVESVESFTASSASPANTTVSPVSSRRSVSPGASVSSNASNLSPSVNRVVKQAVRNAVKNVVSTKRQSNKESKKDCGCSDNAMAIKIKDLEQRVNSLRTLDRTPEDSDLEYNQFNTKNMRSLGEGLQTWKNDYIILNTDKWAPAQNPVPVCKTEKKCPVCPNVSAGFANNYTTLKDFNPSRKVMGPDNMSGAYLEKLNKGK